MGVLAGDYDIEQIYLDGSLKIGGGDLEGLGVLLDHITDVAPEYVKVIVTVSADLESLTDNLKKYL